MTGEKRNRTADIILTALFCIFILAVGLLIYILPQESFSENENSELQTFPSLSYNSFMHGDFTRELAEFYTDQIPCRDFLVGLKGSAELLLLRGENNGVLVGKNGHLISKHLYTDKNYDNLKLNSLAIKTFEKNAAELGIDVTVSVAPRAIDVLDKYLPALYSADYRERAWQTLNEAGLRYTDLRGMMQSIGSGAWFKTDHHWTTNGAYGAYLMLSDKLGYNPFTTAFSYENVSEDFRGTTYSDSGIHVLGGEVFKLPRISDEEEFLTERIDSNGKTVQSFDGYYDESYLEKKDKYSTYLGGIYPVIRVTKPGEEREMILLAKDSFSHSLVPYLAQHYDLLLVDTRYYMGSTLKLARENGIEKVLVLYGIDTMATANLRYLGLK